MEKLIEILNKPQHPFTLIFSFISYYLCAKSQGFASQRNNAFLLFKKVKELLCAKALNRLLFLLKRRRILKTAQQYLNCANK